jgi:hypothetical protein
MRIAISLVALAWLGLWALRLPEPLALDQSLFAFYGSWIGRGLTLYRDLWDSKPPGIFLAYAAADRVAGVAHAAWILDAAASLAASLLSARFAIALGASRAAALVAAGIAGFASSQPVFGGPMLAAQAESLMAPLLVAAALCAHARGRRAAFACGAIVGAAALLKWSALAWLPMVWILSPAGERRDARRALACTIGLALPLAAAAAALAARGALADAVAATVVYPRAYAAEIASRAPLVPALARGALRLGRGLPLVLVWAACAFVLRPRIATRPLVAWLALAGLTVVAQRQMAGYHIFALVPPLALLAGCGAVSWAHATARAWNGARHGAATSGVHLAILAAAVAAPAAIECAAWWRHYTPHVALRSQHIDTDTFLQRLGGPGPRWIESRTVAKAIRAASDSSAADDALLVWGLAPAIYAQAGLRPATAYAFHQTFYVEGAPLARRFGDTAARRSALVARFDRDPPRWVVIVHGDRSGLEPQDSAAELIAFPALATRLDAHYRSITRTPSFALLRRLD